MSQRIVLELLKEPGGKAKTREVPNLSRIKYPESCLYEFVGHKLERLASWGYVYHDRINGILVHYRSSQSKGNGLKALKDRGLRITHYEEHIPSA